MRLLRPLLFSLLLVLSASAAQGQPTDPPDRGERMIERRLDRLAETLGLSAAQTSRVRALLYARAEDARRRSGEMHRLLDARCGARGTRPPDEQRRCLHRTLEGLREEAPQDRMRRENDETARRIRAFLSPEQAERFDALMRAERERWERRMNRPSGDGPDRDHRGQARPGRGGSLPPGPPPGAPPPGGRP